MSALGSDSLLFLSLRLLIIVCGCNIKQHQLTVKTLLADLFSHKRRVVKYGGSYKVRQDENMNHVYAESEYFLLIQEGNCSDHVEFYETTNRESHKHGRR